MQKRKYMRLTSAERNSIEKGLKDRTSIKQIALSLNRSTSTISREIVRNSIHRKTGGFGTAFNNCLSRDICCEQHLCEKEDCEEDYCCGCNLCFAVCKKYKKEDCLSLELTPYVCNGCKTKSRCTLEKVYYKAGIADKEAKDALVSGREGIDISEAERLRLDNIISPLIRRGHSPYSILIAHQDEIMLSPKTIYKYIKMGLFSAKSIDLYRMVKMKPRKTKHQSKIERQCREGRRYEDFLSYLEKHSDSGVVEIDSVIGFKDGNEKVLLTMQFAELHFMLAFIRDVNTARSVCDVINKLDKKLGREHFEKLFSLLLADNGAEFSNPSAIETDSDGVIRSNVFYCDPRCSFQKPHVENNHDFIRRYLPKGESMNHMTQHKVNEMMNHINSYKRKSLYGLSPAELFVKAYGKGTLKKLGLRIVPTDEIILNPSLFS